MIIISVSSQNLSPLIKLNFPLKNSSHIVVTEEILETELYYSNVGVNPWGIIIVNLVMRSCLITFQTSATASIFADRSTSVTASRKSRSSLRIK